MTKLIALVALALAAQACSVATDGSTDTADFSEATTTGKELKPADGKDPKPCQLASSEPDCAGTVHVCAVPTEPDADGGNVTNYPHPAQDCYALDRTSQLWCCSPR